MGLTYGQAVAAWLDEAMRRRGIASKDELAEKSGVNRTDVFKVASGEGLPTRATLGKLADYLHTTEPRFLLADAPVDALGWVERARVALDMASSIMRTTESARAQRALDVGTMVDAARSEPAARAGEGETQQPRQA